MQNFFSRIYSFVMDFLSVTQIRKILQKLKGYWQGADAYGRMLIAVFFAPSVLVLLWLLAEVAFVVVFTLPGIVIKILSLIFLFCVFWCAAVYFYEKVRGVIPERAADAEKAKDTQSGETGGKFTWSAWGKKP